jgi:predicted permease
VKGLRADLKHAFRVYWRTPVASLIAVAVLAIGMAFVSSFLSLYVDLVVRPHQGLDDGGRLVTIGMTNGVRFAGLPLSVIERAVDEVTSLEAVVGIMPSGVRLEELNEWLGVELVTRGFFDGLRPLLRSGRGIEPAEHDLEAEPVAVVSYSYWQNQLEGRADVIGTTIELELSPVIVMIGPDGQSAESEEQIPEFRIVGVMAPEMTGTISNQTEIWLPLERVIPFLAVGDNASRMLSGLSAQTFGRKSESASTTSVIREIQSRYSEGSEDFNLEPGYRLDAVDGLVRDLNVQRESKRQLQLFLAASALLALVAAANVSLFLLARAPGRRRELGIRMAVGAPLKRLARQLASEAVLLVAVSTVLGLLMSVWLNNFLRGLAFLRQAEWRDVSLFDWRVLSLVGLFLLLLTILVSLAPVLGLKRLGIAASSRQVAARANFAQRVAGTAQIAIAGTLGGAALAFGLYLSSMTLGYPGYELTDRHNVQFNILFDRLSGANPFQTIAVDAVRNREIIEAIPGVRGVTLTSLVPASQSTMNTRTIPDPDDPTREISIGYGNIDDAFADVLGLRLLYGRSPDAGEDGVALVNRSFAQRFFGHDNVVGENFDFTNSFGPRVEIVGVLENLSFVHPAADVEPMLFMKLPPTPFGMGGVVESSLTATELLQRLQDLIESGDLELGQPVVRPLSDLRDNLVAPDKARSLLTIGTATLVVLLAAFGFYGTQRYLVTAGRREYAIRASLGAGPRALGRLVFVRGLWLSLPGLVVGALLAFILVSWLRDDFLSREVSPGLVTIAVVAGLALLLLAASYGPARQAKRTQPAPLLREE